MTVGTISMKNNYDNYDDYDVLKCVSKGTKGIHNERHPSRYAHEQNKRQLDDYRQANSELGYENDKLHESLENEIHERILLYKRIVCESVISYIMHPSDFDLKRIFKHIGETIKYFEKVYSYCNFDEIPNCYLTCIKILSFLTNIVNGDEGFIKIKEYCFNDFKCKYNQYFRIEEKTFDNLFNEAIKYGNQLYSQFNDKNVAVVNKLINDL